jgi:hypothetical protein
MAYAVYAVKWHRDDRRMFVVRCTMAVPDQAQIEVSVQGFGEAAAALSATSCWLWLGFGVETFPSREISKAGRCSQN